MDEEKLVEMHPQLYHMAELGSWPSIESHGLLSTSALLDLFEVDKEERLSITRRRRPNKIPIRHSELGSATVRDNKPIIDSVLERCLTGIDKQGWYELLNAHVFFWLTRPRLESFLCARSYRHERHTVITVSTSRLLERQRDAVQLSPINSGATYPANTPSRGPETFATIQNYDLERYSGRSKNERIRELAVVHSVPDISQIVIDVEDTGCNR